MKPVLLISAWRHRPNVVTRSVTVSKRSVLVPKTAAIVPAAAPETNARMGAPLSTAAQGEVPARRAAADNFASKVPVAVLPRTTRSASTGTPTGSIPAERRTNWPRTAGITPVPVGSVCPLSVAMISATATRPSARATRTAAFVRVAVAVQSVRSARPIQHAERMDRRAKAVLGATSVPLGRAAQIAATANATA